MTSPPKPGPVTPRRAAEHWGRLARAANNRRGATALVFAVTGTTLIGTAGLAAEGARIYMTSRDNQNAADAAAMAATSAFEYRGRSAGFTAATEVTGRHGLPASTVTVNSPPASGTFAGNAYAFEVTIRTPIAITLGRVFGYPASVMVTSRSVSLLQGTGIGCVLALTGPLTIQNSSSFNAPNCAVGSNAAGVAVQISQSLSTVRIQKVFSFGTCNGCNNVRWSLTNGYQEHAPPMINPYEALDSKPYVTASGAACVNTTPLNLHAAIQPTGISRAYCASVAINNTSGVTLPAGTYVFQNASLTISNISSVACAGCTFIFRGSSPGNLSLNNTSTVTMSAAASNTSDADYDGILFHRAPGGAMGSSAAPNLDLQNVNSFNLAGGIYFPGSYVRISNVSSSSNTNCLALVGGSIEVSNLSAFSFNVSNCTTYRTATPSARVPRLVE